MKKLFFFLILFDASCKVIPVTSDIYLKTEIESYGLHNGDTLVDIGCGDGTHAGYISHFYPLSYFILEDINAKTINRIDERYNNFHKFSMYIKERHQVVLGTSDSIPLPSASYNYLLCRETLHEFTNPTTMLQEMRRILIVGGKLIVVEAEPIKEGEKDPYCKKLLKPKQVIIDMLQKGNFEYIKSTDVQMKKNRKLAVLIFEKR
jgi:ubiquinone/menaquinone biosynthesis C-methylase UbiE